MKKINVNSPEYRALVTSLLGKDVQFEHVPQNKAIPEVKKVTKSSKPKPSKSNSSKNPGTSYIEKAASSLYHSLNKSMLADIYPEYKNRSKKDEEKFVKVYTATILNVDAKSAKEDEDYWNNLTQPVYDAYKVDDTEILDNDEADIYMEIIDSLEKTYEDIHTMHME